MGLGVPMHRRSRPREETLVDGRMPAAAVMAEDVRTAFAATAWSSKTSASFAWMSRLRSEWFVEPVKTRTERRHVVREARAAGEPGTGRMPASMLNREAYDCDEAKPRVKPTFTNPSMVCGASKIAFSSCGLSRTTPGRVHGSGR